MYSDQKYLGYPANHCQRQSIAGYQVGFPIRKSADQRVLSPPHGLSQSATSFIASYRQGIHQTPFMRLIRSSRRKTTGLRYLDQVILIRCRISPAPRSVHRLGKTAFACPPRPRNTRGEPPDHTNTGARRPPLTRERRTKASRVSLSSRCQRP